LILEADLHRALLRAEAARARARWGWLNVAGGKGRPGPWLLAGAAVAGLLAARLGRKALNWLPTALAAWRFFVHRRGD